MNEAYHHYKIAYKLDRYNTVYSDAFYKIYNMKHPKIRKQRFKEMFGTACLVHIGCELMDIGWGIVVYNALGSCCEDHADECNKCF